MISFGTVSGGVGAQLTGGNFWQGAVTGLVVSGLNHAMHKMETFDEFKYKNKIDQEVEKAYSNPDGVAPPKDATLVDMKNKLPTLKRIYPKTGNAKMYAQPDYDYAPSDGVSEAKTFAYDIDNYKVSTMTFFKSSFSSYRNLAYMMIHEFGHAVNNYNMSYYNYRRSHTETESSKWSERQAFKFAFDNGGIPYRNDPWYLMNK